MVCLCVKRISARNFSAGFLRFPGQPYDSFRTGVNVLLRKPSFLHGLFYLRVKHTAAVWHLQIAARPKRFDSVVHCAPIRDDKSLKAPLVTQDICQKLFIVTGKRPVYLIIGTHHGVRTPLPDSRLKSRQIDFAQRPLVNHAVAPHALLLLIVCRIVL